MSTIARGTFGPIPEEAETPPPSDDHIDHNEDVYDSTGNYDVSAACASSLPSKMASQKKKLQQLKLKVEQLKKESSSTYSSSPVTSTSTSHGDSSNARIITSQGLSSSNNTNNSSSNTENNDNSNHNNRTPTKRVLDDDDDPHKSFHIGMELFGQEVHVVEQTLQDKLDLLESEIQQLQRNTVTSTTLSSSSTAVTITTLHSPPPPPDVTTEEFLQREAKELHDQIQMLRHCSQIRALIDESIQWSSSLSWSTTSTTSTLSTTSQYGSCSSDNSHNKLVEAAKCLMQAHHVLEQLSSSSSTTTAIKSSSSSSSLSTTLQSLQNSIRQQRVHLINVALAWFKVDFKVDDEPSHARNVGTTGLCHSLTVCISPKELGTAYEVMDVLHDTKLHQMLRQLLLQLYQQTFQPALTTATGDDDNNSPRRQVVAWQVTEVSCPPHNQGRRLEWFQADSLDDDEGNARIEDDEIDSATTTSSIILHWKYTLELWTQILTFVAYHVVLQRSNTMQQVVGPYLFGKSSPSSQQLEHSSSTTTNETASSYRQLLERAKNELGLSSSRSSKWEGNECTGLLLDPLMDAFVESCVPSTKVSPPSALFQTLQARSQELHELLHPFVESLVHNGFIVDRNSDPYTHLSNFPMSLGHQYVGLRNCSILQQARDMIQEIDYQNTIRVGDSDRPWCPMSTTDDDHKPNDKSKTNRRGSTNTKVSNRAGNNKSDSASSQQQRQCILEDGMSIFQLPDCSISVTAREIMKLCRSTMDEAVEMANAITATTSSDDHRVLVPLSQLPVILFRSSREVLDIFRAMVNINYGSEIEHVPRTAAIFHNDCVYMAHHCLTLGLEYKDQFPMSTPSSVAADVGSDSSFVTTEDRPLLLETNTISTVHLLRQSCVFVDMVPLFRDFADKSMGDMLHRHATALVNLIGPQIALLGPALRSDEILLEWSGAEKALERGLYHLRQLMQAWKPILSKDVLVRALWYLSDVVLTLYLDQVTQNTTDISSNACQFVHTLFQTARHGIADTVGQEQSGGGSDLSRVWARFVAIEQFMNMTLAKVQVALTNGTFLDVQTSELSHLIVAAFDDTPQRKNLLSLLSKCT